MRKYLVLTLFAAVLLTGCAMAISPVPALYSDVKAPLTATAQPTYSKVGTATCTSILGIISKGDASIEAAAKKAGITKIHHVDYRTTNLFGIYATYTVYVYGD